MKIYYIGQRISFYGDSYVEDPLGGFYFGSEQAVFAALEEVKNRSSSNLYLKGKCLVEKHWLGEKVKYSIVEVELISSLPDNFEVLQ